MILASDSVNRLLLSPNYRTFISIFKEERSRSKRFSYSQIARQAGFSSRSFPRDVAKGDKRLTSSSLYPMIKGLGLRGDLAECFKILVFLEHPELCIPKKDKVALKQKLRNLRDRVQSKSHSVREEDPYQSEFFPIIYSACGNQERGASIQDIQKKTSLDKASLEKTLNNLVRLKILKKIGLRYVPTENHLFFEKMVRSDGFKKFFQYLLEQASEEGKKEFSSDNKLFFASCFSVRKDKMTQLKADMKQLLLEYVDTNEDPDGDKIASVVCSVM